MSKHRNIPVKSYFERAKMFGYLILIVALSMAVIYLFEKFVK